MSKLLLLCCFTALTYAENLRHTLRITGGTNAKPEEAPYYVSIWYKPWLRLNPIITCGGAILNEQWILTGAYCVDNVDNIFVKAGTINAVEYSETVQISDVALAIGHPNFTDVLGPFDIALIKLKTSLKFNKFVSSIALPPADTDVPLTSGKVMGFGSTNSIASLVFPEILQIVSLPIIKNEECKKLVDLIVGEELVQGEDEKINLVDEWRFCTGPTETNQGHCLQDTGSPLTTVMNGKDVLVGVANFGFAADCSLPSAPSIYTRVSAFISWIQETINAN